MTSKELLDQLTEDINNWKNTPEAIDLEFRDPDLYNEMMMDIIIEAQEAEEELRDIIDYSEYPEECLEENQSNYFGE